MKILVTGATGKLGQHFIARVLSDPAFSSDTIVALCHKRLPPPHPRIAIIQGSIADPQIVEQAMAGVTHVFHLATVKETPQAFIDISIKGLFNVLEACRKSRSLRQFVLIGGDAAVGHCFVQHESPVTETTPRTAYSGVYALSKVLEETMVEQYQAQYGLPTTILRAPWIMEKDDLCYALSFGPDQFGGPDWNSLISAEQRAQFNQDNRVPLLLDFEGRPLLRNFIHVSDLVASMLAILDEQRAIGELFNIAMTNPVDYGALAQIVIDRYGRQPVSIETPFYSNLLCNSKARLTLRWQPKIELEELVTTAFDFRRPSNDPRQVFYPG